MRPATCLPIRICPPSPAGGSASCPTFHRTSLIPLYFARTATFVDESRGDTPEAAEARIASSAETFLELKPYLAQRLREGGRASLADQRATGEQRDQPLVPVASR